MQTLPRRVKDADAEKGGAVRPVAEAAPAGSINYDLLLRRLEKVVIFAPDAIKAKQYLSNPKIWQTLPAEHARRWAALAEVAGLMAVAQDIHAWLAKREETSPHTRPTPLSATGGVQTAPVAIAAAAPADAAPPESSGEVPMPDEDSPRLTEADALTTPFDSLRREEKGLERYMALFQGREDCFARQWVDREAGSQGYVPVRRALEVQDVRDHLKGHKTYGIYLLQSDSRTRLGVIDADLKAALRRATPTAETRRQVQRERDYLLSRLPEISKTLELPCLTEVSGGKGYHFWYFWEQPVPAALVRRRLEQVVQKIAADMTVFDLEVFPKQDRLAGKGLGNLVKLPLGIHRVSGRASSFTHVSDRSIMAQLQGLSAVQQIAADAPAAEPERTAEVVSHPRHQQWSATYPELALLTERCLALSTLMAACRQQRDLMTREEKILLGTLGFLPRAKTLLHHLFQFLPDYNPHLLDYKLSRLRGSPLGCKRIHSLMALSRDFCRFTISSGYSHPLYHLPDWQPQLPPSETVTSLNDALDRLQSAIGVVQHFMKR